MTNFYIAAAWLATFGIVGAYAVSVIIRGRRLAAIVPADRRRWMGGRDEGAVPLGDPVERVAGGRDG